VLSSIKKLLGRVKSRSVKPLVGHKHDIKLLQKAHKRKFPKWKQVLHFKKILSNNERKVFNLSFFVLIISVIFVGYNFVGEKRDKIPTIGGRYTEAVVGSPQLVNPIFATVNDVDVDLVSLIYSGLMKYNKDGELDVDLAESYEELEDGKVYNFKLKQNIVWHDGESFSAKDVVYTIETIQNQEVNSPLLVSFQGVGVEALDDFTVQFTLKESFAAFLSSLTVGILPEHVWFDITSDRFKLAPQNLRPIGTGPFIFKKLSKDETGYIYNYELSRFEQYYEESAFIEEVAFQFFPDYDGPGGAIEAFRGQKVDGLHFVPTDLKEKVERKHIVLHTLQLPQYTALFFNQNRQPALESSELRKSLAYALDKNRILRDALDGEGRVIYSPILPGYPGYNPEVEKTPYSVEEANEMLDKKWDKLPYEEYRTKLKEELLKEWEEEYDSQNPVVEESETTDDVTTDENTVGEEDTTEEISEDVISEPVTSKEELKKQIEEEIDLRLDEELNEAQLFFRKNSDDEILEINLVTAETKEYRQAAELIAGFWQEIGVKTNLKFISPRDMSREVLKNRSYDVLLYGEIVGSDPDQYPFWHSSQINYPGLNLAGYVNRNADALLESARETTDDVEEVELYKKFQDILLAERPAIFLYIPTYTYATSDEVKGIDVTRISNPSDRFVNITSWYTKTKGAWNFSK
jgi:ABC-type transport system substrate-binding protein